jgi:hypothetical protein
MIDIELYNRSFFKTPPDKSLPNWKRWVEIFDEMKVHTRGDLPGDLLSTQRPNEDENVYTYRLSIFQPITKSSINRSINRLFRIFLNSNFSYSVSDQLELYLKEKIFEKRAFFEYFHGIVVKRMIEDPNGYLAWLPYGKGLTSQTDKVEVMPEIIDSCKIWYVDDEVLTWTYEEIVDRKTPGEFWSLTKEGYYRHVRKGDNYLLEEIYKHDLEVVPALVLGGIFESEGVLESYFNSFLPFGNEAIRQFSDCQAVNVTSAFPFRTERYTECDYPQCHGHGWWDEEKNGKTKTVFCPVCKGSGYKPHTSPYGKFIWKEPGPGEDTDTAPMITFTSPAKDILEYQQTTWQTLLELARKSLFDETIDEAQSGKAKLVDKEDEHAFYASISDNIYDHLLINSLKIINGYRDISSKEEVSITKPTSFVIKTETDLVNELGVLLEKNAPLPFVLETVKDLAKKRFSTNKASIKVIDFLMVYDPLFALGPEEKNMLIATNVIDDQTRGKNINSYQVLMRELAKNPDLFEGSYDSIEQKMDTEIDKLIVKSKVVYDENGEPVT